MNLDVFVVAVLWVFLGFFAVSSALSLASLPSWGVPVPEPYKKLLFRTFLAQIAASLIGLVTAAYTGKLPLDSGKKGLPAHLVGQTLDWQWAEGNWYASTSFSRQEKSDNVLFRADVFFRRNDFVSKQDNVALATFESTAPIRIGDALDFQATMNWKEGAKVYRPWEARTVGVETPTSVRFELQRKDCVVGKWYYADAEGKPKGKANGVTLVPLVP